MAPILEIEGLKTRFQTRQGTVKALDGVNLSLDRGETLGVVGESGSGKTVLALSIMRLVPQPQGTIVAGRILFKGKNLLDLSEKDMRNLRGKDLSMIFQEPMNSLNPVIRIGEQIAESVHLHRNISRSEAMDHALEMLKLVGMPSPEARLKNYPHQMSGGMRQRVMIAMALSCNPSLMLADEPTTALDVTIQAQILDLIDRLKSESGSSVILITHDLGVIAEAARNAAVMYAGKIVEYAPVEELFSNPLHPYTSGLMESMPRTEILSKRRGPLKAIPGTVPNLVDLPPGCSFQDRCSFTMSICREQEPQPFLKGPGHQVRCWKYN
ncbi:MAG: ABC transporter ATP-binding protein [Syntrophales bacterium]|jgi:peptide/nickel transport system ATP-binding protein/oligopeptide transport system ATP-binding protein|nr:ABC transporter ATP-binding protein [Syntrophales bacterium]MCK9528323.1 ABC transporter ATP-binding protein [Syntrophales bacterium]MDX9922162.1 ABC transporter ATP-binding protein [Syntrophales bacterium]